MPPANKIKILDYFSLKFISAEPGMEKNIDRNKKPSLFSQGRPNFNTIKNNYFTYSLLPFLSM